MTPEQVEGLVHEKTRSTIAVRTLVEPVGDDIAYLSYSVDDHNQLTIWHTEVPPTMQRLGVGGVLVERALEMTKNAGASLRLVCPFAKDYLARHPELRDRNTATRDAVLERESLQSGETF